jgi:WD40-like Beta Propeller Repeat
MRNMSSATLAGLAAAVILAIPASARADHWRPAAWGPAVPEQGVNTAAGEGCPIETPDGLSLVIASNRSGFGVNDIWAADRASVDAPFGAPRKLGPPVSYDESSDFCPLPVFGRSLFFVSTRAGGCGATGGDIYSTRQSPADGWSEPVHLGCAPSGPNTAGAEYSPSIVETWFGTLLYYSSDGGDGGDQDIYVSTRLPDGTFGPGRRVDSLSSEYDDFMPNVHQRDNGTFEVVFNSNRPVPGHPPSQDVYTSTSLWGFGFWSAPQNLGPNVNTDGNETRATISADGKRLHFGRDGDIYVSER